LIEAMIVVVIVGVLAVLAVVGYRKWVQTSFLAEAQDMVSHIRSAEEAFRSENGITYLQVNTSQIGPGYDYPAATPGAFKTTWGGTCSSCVAPNSWQQLAVQPNAPVAYGYSVVTNAPPTSPNPTSYGTPPSIKVNGSAVSLSSISGSPWYVIEADGDYFGTGSFTSLFAYSGNNQVFLNNGTQ
jgi:type IV pilus assembly protein PilA